MIVKAELNSAEEGAMSCLLCQQTCCCISTFSIIVQTERDQRTFHINMHGSQMMKLFDLGALTFSRSVTLTLTYLSN